MNNFLKLILGILRISIERNLHRIRSRATQQRLSKLVQSLPQVQSTSTEDHQVTMATIQERWDLGNDDFVAAILAQFDPKSTTCLLKQPPTKKGKAKVHAKDSSQPQVESSKAKRTPKAKPATKAPAKGRSKRKSSGQGIPASTEETSG